jgi:hypothetical protein
MQAKLAAQTKELAELRKAPPKATPQAVIKGQLAIAPHVPYSTEWAELGVGVCAPDLELYGLGLSSSASPAAAQEDAVT